MAQGRIIRTSKYDLLRKLKRVARRASLSNPVINAPWKTPAPWTSGQTVVIGSVRANAGKMYVANTAGVCGATAPTHTNNVQVSDGTVSWIYFGQLWPLADDAGAPTLTAGSNPSLGRLLFPVTVPDFFTPLGCDPAPYAAQNTTWQLNSFNASAGTPVARHARVGFVTDDPKFDIFVKANTGGHRVIIDGRYYDYSSLNPSSDTHYVYDFSAVGTRKERTVIVEGGKSGAYFGAVEVATASFVGKLATDDEIKAAWISDSMADGSSFHNLMPGHSIPNIFAQMLGISNMRNMSSGGTGHIATNGGAAYNFGQRLADPTNAAILATMDIIIVEGSTNDNGQSGIAAAVTAELTALRAINPTALIIYFGVCPVNLAPVPTTEAAVKAGFDAFDDPYDFSFFIPLSAASPMPMITGAWNNSYDTTALTTNLITSSGDGLHPIDLGVRSTAEWRVREFKRQVLMAA